MASLDVTHDDMIDLLIGHANVGMAMAHNQVSHHNQIPSHHQLPSHHQVNPQLNSPNQVGRQISSQNQVVPQLHSQNQVVPQLNSQNQIGSQLNSQNQIGSQINSQNQIRSHLNSRNQISSHLSSQNQIGSQLDPQSQIGSQLDSQNHVSPALRSQNQIDQPHLDAPNQVNTHLGSRNQVNPQLGSQNQVITTQNEVVSSQHQVRSHNQLSAQNQLASRNQLDSQSQLAPQNQLNSPNQMALPNQMTPQNQLMTQNEDRSQQQAERIPEVQPQAPFRPVHNQYLCPGCQKSILYTNRSSLVQLLSLHQQKCPGTQEYRYMCLECHSAFKSVIQLQEHEGACGSSPNKGCKQESVNSRNTGSVVQSIPEQTGDGFGMDCKPQDEAINKQENSGQPTGKVPQSESLVGGGVERKVMVRESWTQTIEQPKEDEDEFVEILLDEISPAGRKRRTCARKMKVYNEKQMADRRETAELEMMRVISGRRSARACKKDLKRFVKGHKASKKKGSVDETPPEKPEKKEVIKPEKTVKKKEKEPKEQDLEVPLQCQLCPKTFTKYSAYTKHYQLHHERAMCQYCGTQCIRKKLKQHEKSHTKVFKCPYAGCTRILNSKHRLKRHSRVHTGEKPYQCEVCAKPFAGKENMVKHKKRVHDKERKYQCRYCGQKFADKGGLKYHENTHTRQRPTDYRCKYCGRGYKSHVGCYLHERTHTGNMYKCGYCGKEFMAKVHLRKHEYIHTGNYPFRCGNCQKGFPNNGMMKKHKCLAVL